MVGMAAAMAAAMVVVEMARALGVVAGAAVASMVVVECTGAAWLAAAAEATWVAAAPEDGVNTAPVAVAWELAVGESSRTAG